MGDGDHQSHLLITNTPSDRATVYLVDHQMEFQCAVEESVREAGYGSLKVKQQEA